MKTVSACAPLVQLERCLMVFDDWKQLSNPTIRPATPSDVNQIARVHVRGWRWEFRDFLPEDVRKRFRRADSARTWMRLVAGGDSGPYVLVADHPSDGVIGFIAAGPERSENPDYSGEVYALYIDRKHQQSGVGRSLLQYVAQIMSENAQQGLLIWSFSERSNNEFFRDLGAREVSSRVRSVEGIEVPETAFGWPDLRRLLIEGYEEDDAEPEPDAESDQEPAVDEAESDIDQNSEPDTAAEQQE